MRGLITAGLAVGLAAAVIGTAVLASAVSLLGVGSAVPGASATATARIPPAMLALYQQAAATCPGLPWSILAAIGTVESDNGQSTLPGVHSGANRAGAEGPCSSSRAPSRPTTSPSLPVERPRPAPTTRRTPSTRQPGCCARDGAAGGADLSGAVYAYNHSASYVAQVLALAQTYAAGQRRGYRGLRHRTDTGAIAVSWALSQIGTPYVWGGETPGVGFDCSGLVQAAYAVAGVALPRVAQDQYDSTPKLGPGAALAPGDLVFFGGGPDSIDHVGLFVGIVGNQDVMVDAPHTGADVRAEAFPATPGASFGSLLFVGATRPA